MIKPPQVSEPAGAFCTRRDILAGRLFYSDTMGNSVSTQNRGIRRLLERID